jgi:uncharacterized protein YggE
MNRLAKAFGMMLIIALASAVALTGCSGTSATPAAADEKAPAGITVVGEGEVSAAPDVAYISLGVESTGGTAKAAMDANAANMNQVVEKIKALGIEEKDIQTSGLNLNPVYDNKRFDQPDQTPTIVGYRASNQVTITIADVSRAAEVLDGVVDVGANSVSGLQFSIKDDSQLRQQALATAVKKAEDKGKALADALGVGITGVSSVVEDYSSGVVPMRAAGPARDMAESTPVMPGELTVSARIQVTYCIQ